MQNRIVGFLSLGIVGALISWHFYSRPKEIPLIEEIQPAAAVESTGGTSSSVWTFAQYPLKTVIGETPKQVVRKLGPPITTQEKKVENKHEPNHIDVYHELKYDGLTVFIYESSGQFFLHTIIVDGNNYEMREGVRIGMKKDAVLKKFGTPVLTQGNMLLYESGSPAGNTLNFTFYKDELKEVSWAPYSD